MKKDFFYEVTNESYKCFPAVCIDSETLKIFDGKNIPIKHKAEREVDISDTHLRRMGFGLDGAILLKQKGLCVHRLSFLAGESYLELKVLFAGYKVVKDSEEANFLADYRKVQQSVQEEKITIDEIVRNFNSIFTINELFQKLAEYGFEIKNKEEVVTGIKTIEDDK